mgnify:CR=1 FL=1
MLNKDDMWVKISDVERIMHMAFPSDDSRAQAVLAGVGSISVPAKKAIGVVRLSEDDVRCMPNEQHDNIVRQMLAHSMTEMINNEYLNHLTMTFDVRRREYEYRSLLLIIDPMEASK